MVIAAISPGFSPSRISKYSAESDTLSPAGRIRGYTLLSIELSCAATLIGTAKNKLRANKTAAAFCLFIRFILSAGILFLLFWKKISPCSQFSKIVFPVYPTIAASSFSFSKQNSHFGQNKSTKSLTILQSFYQSGGFYAAVIYKNAFVSYNLE